LELLDLSLELTDTVSLQSRCCRYTFDTVSAASLACHSWIGAEITFDL
jgi:hypothetical protein